MLYHISYQFLRKTFGVRCFRHSNNIDQWADLFICVHLVKQYFGTRPKERKHSVVVVVNIPRCQFFISKRSYESKITFALYNYLVVVIFVIKYLTSTLYLNCSLGNMLRKGIGNTTQCTIF